MPTVCKPLFLFPLGSVQAAYRHGEHTSDSRHWFTADCVSCSAHPDRRDALGCCCCLEAASKFSSRCCVRKHKTIGSCTSDIVQDLLTAGRVWTGLRPNECVGLPTVGASCWGLKEEADSCILEHVSTLLLYSLLLGLSSLDPVILR